MENLMPLFILQDQYGQFLNKQMEWVDGSDRDQLFRTDKRDEALNQLIEVNAKDIHLRGRIVECDADSKGRPMIPSAQHESSAA